MAEENKKGTEEELEEQEEGGTEEGTDEGTEKGKGGKEGGSDNYGSKGKTFTQEQVNRMMTREKSQGRNSAYKELGIDPKDTKMVNMFKAFIESQKTDEQKEAEKKSQEAAKVTEAENRAMVAEAKAEAMMRGVKSQYVDDVVTLVLAKLTDDTDVKTLISELKTKYPVWFGKSDEEDEDEGDEKKEKKVGHKGTGSSVKDDKTKGKDKDKEKGLGARLAAQRKAGAKKSSYWGKN